ncbi:hypothetical protein [Streptomyces sp. NPDC051569]|uniref:hypothetical protein n=1 Tax=Streptomyces sp. NPDC051569 TaxID=3365661 RepID=UPI003799F2A4
MVIAWGLAYEDGRAEVTRLDSGHRWQLAAADQVMRYIGRSEECSPRLVWVAPSDVGARAA